MSKKCILLIGGARSGKSSFAQKLAIKLNKPVLFVATAEASDEEMRDRIEKHQKARPSDWSTLEVTNHIGKEITRKIGEYQVVIIDCITLLVNNTFGQYSHQNTEQIDAPFIEKKLTNEISELVECINQVDADFIIVTNEVGTGLVPANAVGRLYRDLLGKANQILAQRADDIYLMVAGLPLSIKPAKYFLL
ncbi:MAG TPA: bifunctional adenosylcobinamide kinase/adenosylcobinamide-phosphate guanylyltransferase [Dehalococcoidia bacterium]|nr:bifunctional adenosylcobinamide kinase/adenosylcobinamide-phosphate guanylyltransferase [Dehalococcoidia bacterium]